MPSTTDFEDESLDALRGEIEEEEEDEESSDETEEDEGEDE